MQLNKIKIRRGLDANLPAGGTEAGELRYSTDSKRLYMDDGTSNVLLATNENATGLATSVTVTPSGTLTSTNAQSALIELDTKKIARVTSTDNMLVRFDGTNGDLQGSLVGIGDAGSINIPTGQNYNINGVALKDVVETLTNKTLTSPVLNTEVTGTGVTTTGEANKVIKANSLGHTLFGMPSDDGQGCVLQVGGSQSVNSTVNGVGSSCYFKFNQMTSSGIYRSGGSIRSEAIGSYASGIGSTYSSDIIIETNSSGDIKESARFLSTGGVKIADKLYVNSVNTIVSGMTASAPKLVVANANQSVLLNKSYSATSTAPAGIVSVGRSRGATVGTETTTLTGDALGYYVFEGVGLSNTPVAGASIEGIQYGPATATQLPTYLSIKTSNGTSLSESMRITSEGVSMNSSLGISPTNLSSYATDGRILNTYRTSSNGTYKFGGIFANTYRDVSSVCFTSGMWFESTTESGIHSATDMVFGANMDGNSVTLPIEGLRLVASSSYPTPPTVKIASLAGTGNRMVVADSTGKLSAVSSVTTNIAITDVDTQVGQVSDVANMMLIYIVDTVNNHRATFITTPNYYAGSDIKTGLFGYSASPIYDGGRYTFRLGPDAIEIVFPTIGGQILLRRQTPGTNNIRFTTKTLI